MTRFPRITWEKNTGRSEVGSTWEGGRQIIARGSGELLPRKMAPAFLIKGSSLSGSEVIISRCSGAISLAAAAAASRSGHTMTAP
jgi:hypothetical protein